jgi:hypothetical protein
LSFVGGELHVCSRAWCSLVHPGWNRSVITRMARDTRRVTFGDANHRAIVAPRRPRRKILFWTYAASSAKMRVDIEPIGETPHCAH